MNSDPRDNPAADRSDSDAMDVVETQLPADDDGLEHLRIEVRRIRTNRRLDKYLAGRLGKDTSRNALQRYIREGNVTVNERIVKPSYTIRVGDLIDMMLPEVKKQEIPAEDIPLDVIFEDDDLIAINKQSNLIVHPARGNWTGTLVNALAWHFKMNWRGPKISELPTSGEAFRPGIVHRLDRDTTGVMLVAKSELALWRLGWQFEHRKIQKTYTAICHGLFKLDEDIIDHPIGKHPKIREKYAVHRKTGKPYPSTTKQAVTRYKVLQRIRNVGRSQASFTLVELYPKTGRTHQLRVHTSAMNHPIVGDKMYGGGPLYRSQLLGQNDRAEGPLITRQALHAHTIEFAHPRTNKPMTLDAPWPADFTETLEVLQTMAREL
ncbi:MAG: RluA family pseudouridine synthase [Phycisphaerae bacterium]|nr:RluA family pseudouridine synthase [Phycisphaerae bacterium]